MSRLSGLRGTTATGREQAWRQHAPRGQSPPTGRGQRERSMAVRLVRTPKHGKVTVMLTTLLRTCQTEGMVGRAGCAERTQLVCIQLDHQNSSPPHREDTPSPSSSFSLNTPSLSGNLQPASQVPQFLTLRCPGHEYFYFGERTVLPQRI